MDKAKDTIFQDVASQHGESQSASTATAADQTNRITEEKKQDHANILTCLIFPSLSLSFGKNTMHREHHMQQPDR